MKIFNNQYSLINAFLPFIIICFFLLDSMIYKNIKGIVFLIGLSFTIMMTIFVGNSFDFSYTNMNDICQPFTINNTVKFTKFPLNPSILIFTAIYLPYTIFKNNFVLSNLNFLIIIALVIISDSLWLIQNNCYNVQQLLVSSGIGLIVSLIWSVVIHKSNNKSIIYTLGVDNNSVCEVPKKKTFKCKYKPTK